MRPTRVLAIAPLKHLQAGWPIDVPQVDEQASVWLQNRNFLEE